MEAPQRFRIAAVADLHYGSAALQPLPSLAELAVGADVFVVCGDLTDHGLPEEAQGLVRELSAVKAPIVAVLGNHDYESGFATEISRILTDAHVTVLDGSACEIAGVGFAGAKGFCGGFDRQTLEPWGEPIVKAFVQEAVSETLKLESALARLRTSHRVALLHYAPVRTTVEGEPADLFPFLGCSRLEDPLNRYAVSVVFHGHAHCGTAEGRTRSGAPVFNVALPLLRREHAPDAAVRIFDIDHDTESQT
jgi:Icc-related predicted phosphoesterase